MECLVKGLLASGLKKFAGDCPACVEPESPPVEGGETNCCAESGVVLRCDVVWSSIPWDDRLAELMSIPRPDRISRGIDGASEGGLRRRVSSMVWLRSGKSVAAQWP